MCEAFLNETQLNGKVDNHMDDYDQGCRSFQPCLLELESTDKRNQTEEDRRMF